MKISTLHKVMNNTKNILSILIILTLFSSCKDKEKSFILKGRLMTYCGIPANNSEISFSQKSGFTVGGISGSGYTDENGYFEIVCKNINNNTLQMNSNSKIMVMIPMGKNLDLGTLYENASFNLIVNYSVLNPYTSNDTLTYTSYDPNELFIKRVGPFNSTMIDTFYNCFFIKYPLEYGYTPQLSIGASFPNHSLSDVVFDVNLCDSGFSETTLVID